MQRALNRHALHGEVNPLFKRHLNEGEQPSTYIPATKRREIYAYMQQVNYNKYHEGKCIDPNSLHFCKETEP